MNENIVIILAIFYAIFATIVIIIALNKKDGTITRRPKKMTTQYGRWLERKRNRKRL